MLLFRLWVFLSLIHLVSSICTVVEHDIQTFEPFVVPCPALGGVAVVKFSFKMPPVPSDTPADDDPTTPTSTHVSVAVSHGPDFDQTDGITLLVEGYGLDFNASLSDPWKSCEGIPFTAKTDDTAPYLERIGEVNNAACSKSLTSNGKLCTGLPILGIPESSILYYAAVSNDGGCTGSVRFEATLGETDSGTGECLSAIEEHCPETARRAHPDFMAFPTAPPSITPMPSTTATPTLSPFCTREGPKSVFEPIIVPCPRLGASTVVSFGVTYQLLPESTLASGTISVTASTGPPNYNSYNGLSIEVGSAVRFSPSEWASCREPPSAFLGGAVSSDPFCIVEEPGFKLCHTTLFGGPIGGETQQYFVGIKNTAGCTGDIRVEAAFEDGDVKDADASLVVPGDCNSPLALHCAQDVLPADSWLPPTMSPTVTTAPSSTYSPTNAPVCFRDTLDDSQVATYEPLEVPCPAEGEMVVVSFNFTGPLHPNAVFTIVETKVSVAAAHGPNFDEFDGITLFVEEDTPDIFKPELLQCNEPLISPDAIVGNSDCEGDLESPTKLCAAKTVVTGDGGLAPMLAAVRNDGSCEGSVRFEVNIFDDVSVNSMVDVNLWVRSDCQDEIRSLACDLLSSEIGPLGSGPISVSDSSLSDAAPSLSAPDYDTGKGKGKGKAEKNDKGARGKRKKKNKVKKEGKKLWKENTGTVMSYDEFWGR